MSAFPQIAMYGHYIQKWSIQFSLLLLIFVFSECCLKICGITCDYYDFILKFIPVEMSYN